MTSDARAPVTGGPRLEAALLEDAALRASAEPQQIALLRRMAAVPDEARRLIDEGGVDPVSWIPGAGSLNPT
jgi:hypothetical protein